jgi:hypothetical protein
MRNVVNIQMRCAAVARSAIRNLCGPPRPREQARRLLRALKMAEGGSARRNIKRTSTQNQGRLKASRAPYGHDPKKPGRM